MTCRWDVLKISLTFVRTRTYLFLQEEKPETEEAPAAEVEPKEETPVEEAAPVEPVVEEETPAEEEAAPTVETAPEATAQDAAPQAEAPVVSQERGRRVYVGNLAWEVSWQDLKDHMRSTGLDAVRSNIMETSDGRSKGCGIIEFATPEDAEQAVLTLNDTDLKGRQIFVREDREDSRPSEPFAHAGGHVHAGGVAGHQFSAGETAQGRRVYVGNLSWDVAWQDLKDHMRQAGEVLHAEVIMEQSGRSKGCGIVEFATEAEAQEAITNLTDTELKNRMIFVREDRETSSQAGAAGMMQNTSVYVWNLAPETSWQDLKDHMRKAGNVDSATIMTNPEGESIGCGVVSYQKAQEAARAIRELQNSEINGQPMYVRKDRAQSGRGGRGGRGRGGRGGRGRGGRGGRGYGGRS